MYLRKIIVGTALMLAVSTANAESVSPYYFDLVNLNNNASIASNFINNQIRELGGIERVREGAKAGHDKSSFVMGYIYLEGHVYNKNVDMAVDILSNASSKSGYSAFLLGKHLLDLTNEYGYSDSVKEEGAALIESAAMSDIAEAEFLAGMLFINGDYLPEDRDMGMMHIRSAAYKGHAPSRAFLSDIERLYYHRSDNFDRIQKMATEGNVEAIIELALMYKEGWRVSRDTDKAKRLLRVASSRGSKNAEQLLRNF